MDLDFPASGRHCFRRCAVRRDRRIPQRAVWFYRGVRQRFDAAQLREHRGKDLPVSGGYGRRDGDLDRALVSHRFDSFGGGQLAEEDRGISAAFRKKRAKGHGNTKKTKKAEKRGKKFSSLFFVLLLNRFLCLYSICCSSFLCFIVFVSLFCGFKAGVKPFKNDLS